MLAEALEIFGRRQRRPAVEAGAVYSREDGDRVRETARVLSVGKDGQGIDHVRFHVKILHGNTAFVDEERILNLDSFADRYRERVEG